MKKEYVFSGKKGVRGKYYKAYRKGHTVRINNESEMAVIERWQWIINSYQEWIDAGHNMKPQLDLVEQIANSKYAEEFYPCTSIATLLISNFEAYSEQIKTPSISVRYLGNQSFKITFSENPSQTHKTEKFKCHQSQVFSLLESLFLRMNILKNQPN